MQIPLRRREGRHAQRRANRFLCEPMMMSKTIPYWKMSVVAVERVAQMCAGPIAHMHGEFQRIEFHTRNSVPDTAGLTRAPRNRYIRENWPANIRPCSA